MWPRRELDGLATRDLDSRKVILPAWLDVVSTDVANFSLLLADRLASKAKDGLDGVVSDLLKVLRPEQAVVLLEDQRMFDQDLSELR